MIFYFEDTVEEQSQLILFFEDMEDRQKTIKAIWEKKETKNLFEENNFIVNAQNLTKK